MKINESTTIITPRILLVPYSAHHVPTYHSWMQDADIQKATASDPLTLDEEYAMQRSWRTDADKLTFIVCTHAGALEASVSAGALDGPEAMVGDVNLFLYDDDEDDDDDDDEDNVVVGGQDKCTPRRVIGELEIMIARPENQGKGLAQETLRAFLAYIQTSMVQILCEFAGTEGVTLGYLRVKIDKDNVRSLRLFEKMGFVGTGAGPNYFGEVEMRTPVVEGTLREVEGKVGLEGFGRMVEYKMDGSRD